MPMPDDAPRTIIAAVIAPPCPAAANLDPASATVLPPLAANPPPLPSPCLGCSSAPASAAVLEVEAPPALLTPAAAAPDAAAAVVAVAAAPATPMMPLLAAPAPALSPAAATPVLPGITAAAATPSSVVGPVPAAPVPSWFSDVLGRPCSASANTQAFYVEGDILYAFVRNQTATCYVARAT